MSRPNDYNYLKVYLNKTRHKILITWLLWEQLDASESASRSILRKLYSLMRADTKWATKQRQNQKQMHRNAPPLKDIRFTELILPPDEAEKMLSTDRQESRHND